MKSSKKATLLCGIWLILPKQATFRHPRKHQQVMTNFVGQSLPVALSLKFSENPIPIVFINTILSLALTHKRKKPNNFSFQAVTKA